MPGFHNRKVTDGSIFPPFHHERLLSFFFRFFVLSFCLVCVLPLFYVFVFCLFLFRFVCFLFCFFIFRFPVFLSFWGFWFLLSCLDFGFSVFFVFFCFKDNLHASPDRPCVPEIRADSDLQASSPMVVFAPWPDAFRQMRHSSLSYTISDGLYVCGARSFLPRARVPVQELYKPWVTPAPSAVVGRAH